MPRSIRSPEIEYHYFSYRWPDGRDWYESHFEQKPGIMLGEKSPSYLDSPIALFRIKEVIPDAKIIAILRDPVDRIYSHYWHVLASGNIGKPTFGQFLESHGAIAFNRSTYWSDIKLVKDLFKDVHILSNEQLVLRQSHCSRLIQKFLGVDICDLPVVPHVGQSYPVIDQKDKRYLARYFRPHDRKLIEMGYHFAKSWTSQGD